MSTRERNLVQDVHHLLRETGPGRMMNTAYDTAWVARLDALGPCVDAHQCVGDTDGGSSVGHCHREEVGQCAVQSAAGVGVDARTVHHGRREVRVEMLEHHRTLEADQGGG